MPKRTQHYPRSIEIPKDIHNSLQKLAKIMLKNDIDTVVTKGMLVGFEKTETREQFTFTVYKSGGWG